MEIHPAVDCDRISSLASDFIYGDGRLLSLYDLEETEELGVNLVCD